MDIKKVILLIIIIITAAYCSAQEKNKKTNYKFIYVHGFGERRFPPAFEKKMKKYLKTLKVNAEIKTHRWDSQKMDLTKVVYQWKVAKENADKEGVVFAEEIIKKYEKEKTRYFLIGYSLGCRVIAESFKHCEDLKYLRGVYFLGAALPKDIAIERKPLPQDMKIINYYSDFFDSALKISFSNAEGTEAGGEVGFSDHNTFENYRTSCTHVYKGGPIQRDYSDLVKPIVYLSFYKEKIFLRGDKPNFNIDFPVAKGVVHWNDVYQFGNVLIQQNVNSNLFRAVSIENEKRTRKAWGENLHEILKELGLFN